MRGIDDALAGKIPTAEQREAVQQFSPEDHPQQAVFPPGALLIFDLDLLKVERAPQMTPLGPATAAPPSAARPKSP